MPESLGKASGEELKQLPHLHPRAFPHQGAPGASGKRESCFDFGVFFVKKTQKKERQQKLPGEGAQGPAPPAPPRLSLSISIFAFVYFYIGNFKHLYFNNPVKHYELPPIPPSPKPSKDWDKKQEVS